MATTADFRNGLCLEYNGKLYTIVQFQHVKPGKGGAFVRTKLKNLETGKVIENTFNAGVKINTVRVERRPYQYLYKDDMGFIFMHTETFEQITINKDLIENPLLLKEGLEVEVL
ncbi:MAG: elongation factor P, partial [Bacteroidota bacterium]